MIVEYKGKQLTKTQLTDDVMNAALEREEIINMPVAIAKDACYQYLGHSAVWEEEFAAFEAELRREPDFENCEIPALDVIAALSKEVGNILRGIEEYNYRNEHLLKPLVVKAVRKVGISCDLDCMMSLLACLAVSGRQALIEECKDILEDQGITADDVCRIADCYET